MKRTNVRNIVKQDEKRVKKSETSGDLLNMFDDGTEKRGETSFMDLPDDILINIFKLLDFPSRFKLRLNKRLDQLQFSVKNILTKLELYIYCGHCELKLNDIASCISRDIDHLERGLRRVAINTSFDKVALYVKYDLNERKAGLFDAISKIEADSLNLYNSAKDGLPQLTLPILLNFAQNIRMVEIEIHLTSLSAPDLCTLRKAMLEEGCKLESFVVAVIEKSRISLSQDCFGVTIEKVDEPVRGKIYRAADESIELYSIRPGSDFYWEHYDYEAHFKTSIENQRIRFRKGDIGLPRVEDKIILNHFYVDYDIIF